MLGNSDNSGPSVIVVCLRCQATRNPAFSSTRMARWPEMPESFGTLLRAHFDYASLLACRQLFDDLEVVLDRFPNAV